MTARRTVCALVAVWILALCLGPSMARADVEEYIPQDAVAVVKVTDLASHYRSFVDGALARRLQDPAFLPQLAAGIQMVRQQIQEFERTQDVHVADVLLDLLGREAALATFADETAVVVMEGRDARALQNAVEEFLRVERLTGSLRGDTVEDYKGVEVHCCMTKDGRRFHALSGRALAVSEHRSAVARVIDVGTRDAAALSDSAKYRDAMHIAEPDALITGYLDAEPLKPMAEAALREMAGRRPSDPGERLGLRWAQVLVSEIVPNARFAVLSVAADDDLSARLTVAYEGDRLPALVRSMAPQPGSRIDMLDLAPDDAVLAAARNVSVRGAWDAFLESLVEVDPEAARQAREVLDVAVSVIGGVYTSDQLFDELAGQSALFVLPSSGPEDPPGVALAVKLQKTVHIPLALEMLFGIAAVGARSEGQDVRVEAAEYNGVQLTTLRANIDEPWAQFFSFTVGLAGDSLIVTTTLEAARAMVDQAQRGTGQPSMGVERTAVGCLRVNLPAVNDLLTKHREVLVRRAVREEGKTANQARRELDALGRFLSLLDALELTTSLDRGRTEHHLTLRFAEMGH